MIIPVRIPRAASTTTVGGVKPSLPPGHPFASQPCPLCDDLLTQAPVTLVFVGIDPQTRSTSGTWCTGAAVYVHATCAGLEVNATACDEDLNKGGNRR